MANSPITIIDKRGDIIEIVGSDQFKQVTKILLEKLRATTWGRQVVDDLHNSPQTFSIKEAWFYKTVTYNSWFNTIKYKPIEGSSMLEGAVYNNLYGLSHELFHAYQDLTNQMYHTKGYIEKKATVFANYIRQSYGDKRRKRYGKLAVTEIRSIDERIRDFSYESILIKKPLLLGSESSDNTKVFVPGKGYNEVKYIKTPVNDGGKEIKEKSEEIKEEAKF